MLEDFREGDREGGKIGDNDAFDGELVEASIKSLRTLTSFHRIAAPNVLSNIVPIKSGTERSGGWRPR